jgi:hypothetical protein
MPIPQPKDNEKQSDYMGRCMHKVNKDNPKMENKQQVAICLNTYTNPKKKAKANEIEVDFSEDIKKMNKTEETPKTEVKVEEANNTVAIAPSPEVKAEIKIEETKAEEIKAEADGKGEVIQTTLMQMQNQYKILHWQTMSFSQHKSFDEIVSSLSGHIDEFIETYMGKYGRVIAAGSFNLILANYKDANFLALTDSYINFMIGLSSMLDASKDSDLLNIRDEILGSLNQLKYLLTLV